VDEITEIPAQLGPATFAQIVGFLVKQQKTGVLQIQNDTESERLFFLKGIPQGARLSVVRFPIGKLLVDDSVLKVDDLEKAIAITVKTGQLLGQVLIEQNFVNEALLQAILRKQSQVNALSMFALKTGELAFDEGLVHLTDFTPSPLSVLRLFYLGFRDYAPADLYAPIMTLFAFAGLKLTSPTIQDALKEFEPAEIMAIKLLETYRFSGELARSVPLPGKTLAALLLALYFSGNLEAAPAVKVPRA